MSAERRMRVLVVDDEEPARRLLRSDLARHPDVEVVGECANGFEAVQAVAQLDPDLLLLDVQMPKLDGFEVLELLDKPVPVIFVTAYDEYAVRAFEVRAVDYLLKPVVPERLDAALERARDRARAALTPAEATHLAAETRPPGHWRERILVRDGARVHVIPVDRLDYAEAQDDYVCLHAAGERHLKLQSLADLERELDPERFVRIHRSYVLNVERLARVEPYAKDSRVAILRDGTQLPVSRSGYARLRERA
jgi:two-component system LytT family response regulator